MINPKRIGMCTILPVNDRKADPRKAVVVTYKRRRMVVITLD